MPDNIVDLASFARWDDGHDPRHPEPPPEIPDDGGDHAPIQVRPWPKLEDAALQGFAGRFVRAIAPYTEADPAALLATALTMFGAMAGDGPHFLASNTPHPARLHTLVCGPTSDGAKGTSYAAVRHVMLAAQPEFAANIASGLASGEGLIERVRDNPNPQLNPGDKGFDKGVADKRLLCVETEFAKVLGNGRREGNTLLPTLRQAWDGGPLGTMTRSRNSLKATDPHVCLIGHVTPGEYLKSARASDTEGGSTNRLLIVLSKRSKMLPDGGNTPDALAAQLRDESARAISAAKDATRFDRSPAAQQLWETAYPVLARARPDTLANAAVARGVPQVVRLSLTYALMDNAPQVELEHLEAALAFWDYCEQSAMWLFSTAEQDEQESHGEQLLTFIAAHPAGVTRTEIRRGLYSGNKFSAEIDAVLAPLIRHRRVEEIRETPSRGRPTTRYRAIRADN